MSAPVAPVPVDEATYADYARTTTPVDDPATVPADTDDFDRGWFCIATDPYPCPAEGCMFVAHFSTAAHMILVWPSIDDIDLLTQARNCRDVGRNPRIVEYEPDMGPALSWDRWNALGCPVHAFGGEVRPGSKGYERL